MRWKLLGVALAVCLGASTARSQEVPLAFIKVADVTRQLSARSPVVLVDVRTREEYQARHIKGAISIPLNALEARHPEIPRHGLVVLY